MADTFLVAGSVQYSRAFLQVDLPMGSALSSSCVIFAFFAVNCFRTLFPQSTQRTAKRAKNAKFTQAIENADTIHARKDWRAE